MPFLPEHRATGRLAAANRVPVPVRISYRFLTAQHAAESFHSPSACTNTKRSPGSPQRPTRIRPAIRPGSGRGRAPSPRIHQASPSAYQPSRSHLTAAPHTPSPSHPPAFSLRPPTFCRALSLSSTNFFAPILALPSPSLIHQPSLGVHPHPPTSSRPPSPRPSTFSPIPLLPISPSFPLRYIPDISGNIRYGCGVASCLRPEFRKFSDTRKRRSLNADDQDPERAPNLQR